jgi:hypothetical protein
MILNDAAGDIGTHCPNVKKLAVTKWSGEASVGSILAGCDGLTDLTLLSASATANFDGLLGNCAALRKINVQTSLFAQNVTLAAFLTECPELREVRIMAGGYGQNFMHALQASCAHLTSLTLLFCHVEMADLLRLLETCTALRSIDLERVIRENMQEPLPTQLPELKLTHLRLVHCFPRRGMLLAILSKCPHMLHLKLGKGIDLRTEVVANIGISCPLLQSLSISMQDVQVNDAMLCAVGQHFPQLRLLDLREDLLITDIGVCAVAQGCPLLEVLYLPHSAHITDTALQTVAEHCPNLHALQLEGNEYVTDAGVIALLEGCPKLRDGTLELLLCPGLSAEMTSLLTQISRRNMLW